VRLNRARQVANKWSEADRQRTIEQLDGEIDQMTPAKWKLFDIVFQHHERQLLQEVGTKATSPRSIFAKKLGQMKTAAEEEVYGAVNMTADKHVEFQDRLSNAETEATTWSLADIDRIVSQLERETYGITSNEQMRFKQELSICLSECEPWWQATGVQALRKTIEQCVRHFGDPKMHLMSHISHSIRRIGSGDNFITHISERLHIRNVQEAYQSINKVNYIRQMIKHIYRSTAPDYMEETLSYLAL